MNKDAQPEIDPAPAAPSWLGDYLALTEAAGLVDFSRRTLVELTGKDRASFLHNFCTNEIRKLPAGAGCEAFITSVQGKTLAYVSVFATPDALILETAPDQADKIIAHLDRFVIREDVTLSNRGLQWGELLLAGPRSADLLAGLATGELPGNRLTSTQLVLAGATVWLRRVEVAGPFGFLVECPRDELAKITAALLDAGACACSREAFEAARIEQGMPEYGAEITDRNLPQEVGRDALAISFNKGCYLGQETVARIDALGHVNKLLAGIRFERSAAPQVGCELLAAGQPAGQVTSAAWSPKLGSPIALAFVRRGSSSPGTKLEFARGLAEVIELPLR